MALRAVHLEVSHTLDLNSFIQAIGSLIALRGQVKEICSDNGTKFTGPEKELRIVQTARNQAKIHTQYLFEEKMASNSIFRRCFLGTLELVISSFATGAWFRPRGNFSVGDTVIIVD